MGKPIAQHQAIAFKLADMATELKEASMAKLFASDIANKAARRAIQIFGGNGYVTKFPVERHFPRRGTRSKRSSNERKHVSPPTTAIPSRHPRRIALPSRLRGR